MSAGDQFWQPLRNLYSQEQVNVVRTLLIYNGEQAWPAYYSDPSLNPYPNPRDPNVNLNESYLVGVATNLKKDYSSNSLFAPLLSAQYIVDCQVDFTFPTFNCP